MGFLPFFQFVKNFCSFSKAFGAALRSRSTIASRGASSGDRLADHLAEAVQPIAAQPGGEAFLLPPDILVHQRGRGELDKIGVVVGQRHDIAEAVLLRLVLIGGLDMRDEAGAEDWLIRGTICRVILSP